MKDVFLYTALGSGFMLLMTSLGACVTLFFKKELNGAFQRALIGFSAGVMIAASVWSMIIPSIDGGEQGVIPAAAGIFLGAGFIMATDAVISRYAFSENGKLTDAGKRNTLLITAVTLHNIPEGMAVGLLFALGAAEDDFTAAIALAICIGIQNFPEGAAISLPMRKNGVSSKKAAAWGMLSGTVEPPSALLAVAAASFFGGIMPWLLGFAAGAMIYVSFQELIPESHGEDKWGTSGAILGFILMMTLDVALG
ncbi:MAG: ZIP family metal transporter [Clostridia bacterium]|nr:ZIP family metal transporter [Clostridia bacterium]